MHMTVNIDRYIEDMEQWKKTREENERLQQELQRKDNIINDLKNFLNGKYDEWKDSENEIIRESAYEDLRILEYIKELEEK